jgi:phosphatidylinositol alpha-1,6-mannosyltransferase
MKVLYLSTGCFDKGGISRYNRYQISALRELCGVPQVRVATVHPRTAGDFEEPFAVDFVGNGVGALSKILFFLYVLRTIFFWQPNIVWVGHVNLSGMAVWLAKLIGARVVLNTYGLEVWSGLRKDAESGLRSAHVVLSDCHFTARYLEESGYRIKGTVAIIWDCIDLNKFFPREPKVNAEILSRYFLPDPRKHPWIVTLGRLSSGAMHKGYDRLIRVFGEVARQHPSCVLLIGGKGDQAKMLKDLGDQTGFGDRIFFTGMVHDDDLAPLYRMGTVFSLVSDRGVGRGEGIPLTPLEAMACGVPIIVGNDDGSQEAVMEEKNGWVISPHALDTHRDVLLSLLNDEDLRQQKAAAAVVVAKQFFSYPIFVQKHRQLLIVLNPQWNG